MKISRHLAIFFAAFALSAMVSSPLYAQDDDTMIVIDEDATVEDVINVIELPEGVPQRAVENAARGQDTANRAREGGREFGEAQAAEGRSRGQDARENAAQGARDNARDRGRGRGARDGAGDARDGAGDARNGAGGTRDNAGDARDGAGGARGASVR